MMVYILYHRDGGTFSGYYVLGIYGTREKANKRIPADALYQYKIEEREVQ